MDNNSSALASGGCDSLGMKSGCVTNDGQHAMIYRGVENFFGNIFQWLDGINWTNRQAYICDDYTKYASDVFSGDYTQLGYIGASTYNAQYILTLGYDSNNSLVMVPSAVGGSDTSGVTDFCYLGRDNMVSFVGGYWADGSMAGAFNLIVSARSSNVYDGMGGRFVQYDSTAI